MRTEPARDAACQPHPLHLERIAANLLSNGISGPKRWKWCSRTLRAGG